ncbi:hypothetical protein CYY_004920 [Polysphondylium violaceum]|uniref:Tryptophan synthase beta chain-like PALP domain-containing protein n=1 Tax=Polysphondylium violaceum TaxID=133409 RepID=A0A8J4USM3_9MYCE|nr:hypothetical protein CYY_004920 [Polysphondylium violaceum]
MEPNSTNITLQDIKEAHERIKPFVHQTPILTNSTINELCGGLELYFKCENLQKVGAFKFRGATNAVLQLTQEELDRGVVTHSSGNHAQALAKIAKMKNTTAYIVVPKNAPTIKLNAIKGYGANVLLCEPTLKAREENVEILREKHGCVFIHPFDNVNVICGQGTVGLEILDQVPQLDAIVCPVGGGGLLSGICIAAKGINPNITIIAAEPEGANDTSRSFAQGERVSSHLPGLPNTICDGLLTVVGNLTFPIIQQNIDSVITVTDEQVKEAMRLVWERMKIIIEPSSATSLAAVLKNGASEFKAKYPNLKKIALVITGGNVDLDAHFKSL